MVGSQGIDSDATHVTQDIMPPPPNIIFLVCLVVPRSRHHLPVHRRILFILFLSTTLGGGTIPTIQLSP